ncbi:hypothetical protein KOW79_022098 [Hemibagrus wyckioides]|uniref:Uncharacterized protein n=1 Tax=Hemibagrus wyckioides TaxID=337641 RepID=A0A9D3S8Z6_9TELE|nr:hypothetical protein KOW79_022098 [Hemibagrus wyckioides]
MRRRSHSPGSRVTSSLKSNQRQAERKQPGSLTNISANVDVSLGHCAICCRRISRLSTDLQPRPRPFSYDNKPHGPPTHIHHPIAGPDRVTGPVLFVYNARRLSWSNTHESDAEEHLKERFHTRRGPIWTKSNQIKVTLRLLPQD